MPLNADRLRALVGRADARVRDDLDFPAYDEDARVHHHLVQLPGPEPWAS